MEQMSFSDLNRTAKKKITRREKFLSEMNQVVPFLEKHQETETLFKETNAYLDEKKMNMKRGTIVTPH